MKRSLREADYYAAVFPAFDQSRMVLPAGATACTGQPVLGDELLRAGQPGPGTDIQVQEGSLVFGGGGSRLKLVWFKTHQLPDGTTAGPLAVVRGLDELVEVYAVGVYKGSPKGTTLRLERLGTDVVAVAEDNGCIGREPGKDCDAFLHVYLLWEGELRHATTIVLERVRYRQDSEPGIKGRIEYQLTSSPEYVPGEIRVLEQITATDELGREVRRAEQQLRFRTEGDKFATAEHSLWSRVLPRPGSPEAAPDKTDASASEADIPEGAQSEPAGAESEPASAE